MQFDYNFPGPIQSLERYLRILDYDQNKTVYDMSYQICKFQLNDSLFLDYRPSQIAVCSLLIAINIYERDSNKPNFFKTQNGMKLLNTDIWNNPEIVSLTGYSIEMIKEPLYHLSNFIKQNLTPNRLEGFNIEAIKDLKDFELP